MKKLSKTQLAEKQRLVDKLAEAKADLDAKIQKYNQTVAEAFKEVEDEVEAYNNVLQEVRDFTQGVVSEMEDYASGRSEKWQESDAGQQHEEWKTQWEAIDSDLEDYEAEEPEQLDEPSSGIEEFENLPDEAEAR